MAITIPNLGQIVKGIGNIALNALPGGSVLSNAYRLAQPAVPKTQGMQFPLLPGLGVKPGGFVGPTLPQVGYGDLENRSGTIFNAKTNIGYSDPNQLATALGMQPGQINWGAIRQAPATPQVASSVGNTNIKTTSSGNVVDGSTGALLMPAGSVDPRGTYNTQVTDLQGADLQGGPESTLYDDPAYKDVLAMVTKNMGLSPEEESTQSQLDAIETGLGISKNNIKDQAIPIDFITGQQKAVTDRAVTLATPLTKKLALMQAKRQGALDASKFALEQTEKILGAKAEAKKAEADANKPVVVAPGGTLVNPRTGRSVFSAPAGAQDAFTLSPGQVRYGPNGDIIAMNGGGGGAEVSTDAAFWSSLIKSGQAKLDDVPQDLRTSVAKAMQTLGGLSKASQDAISQAGVVMDYIGQADPMINWSTTGIIGKGSANIPGTPAYNLERIIDTIKANVGFSALQAMRAASPTGGALGQVSEQENRLLQATLGSLDIGQSQAQLKANLAKVKTHFTNLINILNQAGAPAGGGGSGDALDNALDSLGFKSGASGTPKAGMRTDRHNNPAAFTTDIAKQAGLVLGRDYTVGDAFPNNPNLRTATLLGDPVATTIKVIDNIGFYTQAGKPRWSYVSSLSGANNWRNLNYSQKAKIVAQMYSHEGGTALKSVFKNYA